MGVLRGQSLHRHPYFPKLVAILCTDTLISRSWKQIMPAETAPGMAAAWLAAAPHQEHPYFSTPEAILCTVTPNTRELVTFYAGARQRQGWLPLGWLPLFPEAGSNSMHSHPYFPRTGSNLRRRKTASGMAAAWLAAAPHQAGCRSSSGTPLFLEAGSHSMHSHP